MISRLFSQKYADPIIDRLIFVCGKKQAGSLLFVLLLLGPATGIIFFVFGGNDTVYTGFWSLILILWCCFLGTALLFICFLMAKRLDREQTMRSELEKQIEQLEQKLIDAKRWGCLGKIAGDTAHDLNNTLSGIGTYPDVLLMDKTLDPKVAQGLNLIKDSGKHASAVVRDLLTISLEEKAQKERVNINFILDAYVRSKEFETLKKKHENVKIDINCAPDLRDNNGSYLHMEKAIMNLFLYALEDLSIKENPWLTIETLNSRTGLQHHENRPVHQKYAVIRFSFNGACIDAKNRHRLFEPFYTKKKMGKGGTGLGLLLVKNTVENHDGYIDLKSDNNDTRFELFFPVMQEK